MSKSTVRPSRIRVFLSYYRPYMRLFLVDMVCAFLVSATSLLLPLGARYITQNVLKEIGPDTLTQISVMALVMLGLVIIQTMCNGFVDYQGHAMGAMMESDLRSDLFAHYQKQSFRFFDEEKTGQLMSRLTNDLFWLSELYHHGPEDLAIAIVTFAGSFIILIQINMTLTLVIFLFLPIMALYAFYFNIKMNRAMSRSKERIADVNHQAEDTLSGIRVVKSFTNEAIENRKFARENNRFVHSRRAVYKSQAYFYGGMSAFTQLFILAVVVCGAVGIVKGSLDLPDLLTFLLYVASLTEPIHRAINFSQLYQEGITGFNRFMEMMAIEPDIQDAADAIELRHVDGSIELRDVSFKYQEDHHYVFRNLSLTISAGEYVAIVGISGVGKTTLSALIPRFYELTGGEILIDGWNIRDIRLQSLRSNIGVVQQDVYLFAGTVADNIRYGKLDATMEEIIAAAKEANAHEFILALPDGYDTDIGQKGVKLSGGQKQRISIARVLLKDPPIIIFDEATSALDNESESAIQEAIEMLRGRRTILVIAHRLSTIRNARRIVLLTENGIDEEGTHDELIATNGTYARLYNLQLDAAF